jgi:hypothetical protein
MNDDAIDISTPAATQRALHELAEHLRDIDKRLHKLEARAERPHARLDLVERGLAELTRIVMGKER